MNGRRFIRRSNSFHENIPFIEKLKSMYLEIRDLFYFSNNLDMICYLSNAKITIETDSNKIKNNK